MSDNRASELKLAVFWPDDPELWFAQTEAQFWYYNIREDLTKFNCTIAQLDKHCLTLVRDVVLSPPPANKYDTLKSQLFTRLKEFKNKNIKEVLGSAQIGARKPSEFLEHLKSLAGPGVEEGYIKSVWTSGLPAKIQWVSSFLTSSSLEKIAQLADLAINSPSVRYAESNIPSQTDARANANNDDVTMELTRRVDDITRKLKGVSSRLSKNERALMSIDLTAGGLTSNSSGFLGMFNQKPNNIPRSYLQEPLILCWYHAHYGWKATKCVQPCNFLVANINHQSTF